MSERSRSVIGRALWTAAGHRTTLLCTGITAGTGIMLQSGTLFVLASCGWAASFAVNLARSQLWREAVQGLDSTSVDLPADTSVREPIAKHFLARLTSTRLERGALMQVSSEMGRPGMLGITRRTIELEGAAVSLIQSLDRMSGFLAAHDPASIRAELPRLQELGRGCDAGLPARLEAERASALVRGRLLAIEQIERCKILVTARLESVIAALEALPCRLARADAAHSSLRALQDDASLAGLGEELDNLDAAARAALDDEAVVGVTASPRPLLSAGAHARVG